MSDKTRRVYIFKVRLGCEDSNTYIYKVGVASGRNSADRLMQIQRSYFMAHRYTFFAKILRDRVADEPFKVETALHQMFAGKNFYHGKQFDGSTEFFKCEEDELLRAFDSILPDKKRR